MASFQFWFKKERLARRYLSFAAISGEIGAADHKKKNKDKEIDMIQTYVTLCLYRDRERLRGSCFEETKSARGETGRVKNKASAWFCTLKLLADLPCYTAVALILKDASLKGAGVVCAGEEFLGLFVFVHGLLPPFFLCELIAFLAKAHITQALLSPRKVFLFEGALCGAAFEQGHQQIELLIG